MRALVRVGSVNADKVGLPRWDPLRNRDKARILYTVYPNSVHTPWDQKVVNPVKVGLAKFLTKLDSRLCDPMVHIPVVLSTVFFVAIEFNASGYSSAILSLVCIDQQLS